MPFSKPVKAVAVLVYFYLNGSFCIHSFLPLSSGERPECGEGWSPAGRQHDPAGRQQPHGESGDGRSKPRAGGHGSEER